MVAIFKGTVREFNYILVMKMRIRNYPDITHLTTLFPNHWLGFLAHPIAMYLD